MHSVSAMFTTLVVALVAGSALFGPVDTVNEISKHHEQEAFELALSTHPFEMNRDELAAVASKENPQARFMQEYLLMVDPMNLTVPTQRLQDANRQAIAQRALRKGSAISWTERGPADVGGRTRALMFDPNDPTDKKVWAGGVAGGLWYTSDITDPNASWQSVNDFWSNIAVSAIAHDPNSTNTFYVGTGEGWFNFDALSGAGIFKSSNGGSSWTQLSSTAGEAFKHVQDIVVTANGSVLATTSDGKGVQRSANGGQTWSTVLAASTSDGRGADLEIGADGAIYASVGVFAPGQIWRSDNDGVDWTRLNVGTSGFPETGVERIEIAAAPSDANRVYAVATNGNALAGMFRSFDRGDTWESMDLPNDCDPGVPDDDFGRGQAWYNLILAVSPGDANEVIAGGIDIFRTTNADAGANWSQMGVWHQWATCTGVPEVHPDHHVVAYRPGSSSVVLGHDGGVSYVPDVSASPVTFVDRNKDYNVTQFYSVALGAAAGGNLMFGGTQDNGTPRLNQSGMASQSQDVTGGDGGYAHMSRTGSQLAVASNQWLRWHRSFDGGINWEYMGMVGSGGSFINPSALDADANHLFFNYSNDRIGRLNNIDATPVSWNSMGPTGGFGAPVTHVRNSEFAPSGTSTVFLGTRNGSIWKLTGGEIGGTPSWTQINTTPLPVGAISSIELHGGENRMVVTLSNYGIASVWQTEDAGASWTNLDDGRGLPDMPVWWVKVDPSNSDRLFIATEAGLWRLPSISGGANWIADADIPTTRVAMLDYRPADGKLVAATHGRGLWTTTISTQASPQLALSVLLEGAYRGQGAMSTPPDFAGVVPTEQPYGSDVVGGAFALHNGRESVSEFEDGVIDWVLVSLRSAQNPSFQVPGSSVSGILRNDGTVIGADGNLIEFNGVAPGSYYVVVDHRNHLQVMSADPIDFSSGFGSWDFSSSMASAYAGGRNPMKDLGDGSMAMFAADASGDGEISVDDFAAFLAEGRVATEGYASSDFNLDGHVDISDFAMFLRNSKLAAASQVPN